MRVSPVWARNPWMRAGWYWMLLEPVLDDRGELAGVGGGEVAQAVLHVRSGALDGLRSGAWAGSRAGSGEVLLVILAL